MCVCVCECFSACAPMYVSMCKASKEKERRKKRPSKKGERDCRYIHHRPVWRKRDEDKRGQAKEKKERGGKRVSQKEKEEYKEKNY